MKDIITTIDDDTANIDFKPDKVSLSAVPNYVRFKSKTTDNPEDVGTVSLQVKSNTLTLEGDDTSKLLLTITSLIDNTEHKFYGTTDAKYVNATTFLIAKDMPKVTAENLKVCLMKNSFVSSNFELNIPFDTDTIRITPLGMGDGYAFSMTYDDGGFFECEASESVSAKIEKEIGGIEKISMGMIYRVPKKTSDLLFTIKDKISNKSYSYYIALEGGNDPTTLYIREIPQDTFANNHVAFVTLLKKNSSIADVFNISSIKIAVTTLTFELKKEEDRNRFLFENINSRYFDEFGFDDIYTYINTHTFTFPSNDSIDKGKNDAVIELDVYTNMGLHLGEEFEPTNPDHQGSYLTSIQKAYFKQPLWFNLNATFGNSTAYSTDFLSEKGGWQDAGTCRDFRIAGYKNSGGNKVPFCFSDIFYVLNGYGRNLEKYDLEKYIFDFEQQNIATPLTRQHSLTHSQGQTQYFNFIASKGGSEQYPLYLTYRLYTQSGTLIGSVTRDKLEYTDCKIVNTIKLNIDEVTDDYPLTGIVEVALSRETERGVYSDLSAPLTYRIQPSCLHKVKDFAFLNSLGGWDSFGFTDDEGHEFSASANTIFKTQTPDHGISSEIESVYNKEIKEQMTVQSHPIVPRVAEWLQQMSASPAVYELSTGRYVIVEDMKLKYNTGDDLVRVEMKYRYSDSYNGLI